MRLPRRWCPITRLSVHLSCIALCSVQSHEIYANNQLCFTPTCPLHLHRGPSVTIDTHPWRATNPSSARHAIRRTVTSSVYWGLRGSHCWMARWMTRWMTRWMACWRVCSGIDWRWLVRKLLVAGARWHRTRGSRCVGIVRVTWRSTELVLVGILIHGKASGGGVVA